MNLLNTMAIVKILQHSLTGQIMSNMMPQSMLKSYSENNFNPQLNFSTSEFFRASANIATLQHYPLVNSNEDEMV